MQHSAEDRTATLIAQAAMLRADLTAVWARSCALMERVRERRLSSGYPLLRPMQGASTGDLALIATTTIGAPLCLDCIADKTGIPVLQVEAALTMIPRAAKLMITLGPCTSCLKTDATFSLAEPADCRPG